MDLLGHYSLVPIPCSNGLLLGGCVCRLDASNGLLDLQRDRNEKNVVWFLILHATHVSQHVMMGSDRIRPCTSQAHTYNYTHNTSNPHLLWQLWIWQRYDSELRQHQERIALLILHLLYSSIETTLHPNSQTSRLLTGWGFVHHRSRGCGGWKVLNFKPCILIAF